MRLVDVEPIIEGWKETGNSKKAKAKALMNSGIYSEYNKGVALDLGKSDWEKEVCKRKVD